jgi:hypothetical protein
MTLWELASNLECQERLRKELLDLGREPEYEDYINPSTLPYLDAVVKEG